MRKGLLDPNVAMARPWSHLGWVQLEIEDTTEARGFAASHVAIVVNELRLGREEPVRNYRFSVGPTLYRPVSEPIEKIGGTPH